MYQAVQRYLAFAILGAAILLWAIDAVAHASGEKLAAAGLFALVALAVFIHRARPQFFARLAQRSTAYELSEATKLTCILAFILFTTDVLIWGCSFSTVWFAGHLVPIVTVVGVAYWLLRRLERSRGSRAIRDLADQSIRRLIAPLTKPEV